MTEPLVDAAQTLRRHLAGFRAAPPVTHTLHPLDYGWELHRAYLKLAGPHPRRMLFVGMNPGPWGMGQTSVPFGDVPSVRDWMGLRGKVVAPPDAPAKKPIEGLACMRREVSGQRFWGWVAARWGTPRAFFAEAFVLNYCPLLFVTEADGKSVNVTPDKLPRGEREAIFPACDEALRRVVSGIRPQVVVGVGDFARKRVAEALGNDFPTRIASIPHPSPASPAANRGWAALADAALDKALAAID